MARKPKAAPAPTADPVAAAQARFRKLAAVAKENPEALEGTRERQGNPRTLAPRVPLPAEMTEQMIKGSADASAKWKARVMKPRKDPIAEAKKAEAKWENSVKAAIAAKRFAKGLDNVNEAAMIATIEATPEDAVAQGVARRRAKIQGKMEKLQPLLVANAEAIDAMPDATPEDRERKMVANLRNMREIKGKV